MDKDSDSGVAPHAGAWIETRNQLKYHLHHLVAPHAGAWIETINALKATSLATVAPHAGAWIETFCGCQHIGVMRSHPMRVRGLKL